MKEKEAISRYIEPVYPHYIGDEDLQISKIIFLIFVI